MKRKYIFLVVFIGVLMRLTPLSYAQEYYTVLEDTLTDNLTSLEDTRWYSFEMTEPGDVTLTVTGLQDDWDGYSYHWNCAIYDESQTSIITTADVSGYSGSFGPSILSALDLDSGTYYVRIKAASSANPLMTTFTTDSYKIQLTRTYSSTQPFVNSSDDNMYIIGAEAFLDRLVFEDQVRWYAFEMTEPGDVTLTVTGLQDYSDGYTYHWNCAIYDESRTSSITNADVSGYSEYSGPSILSVPELDTGIYYVRIKRASSGNPLMTTFTTAPYRIQLTRAKTDGSQSKDTDDDGAEDWSEGNRGNVVLFIAVIVILFIVIRFIVMRFIVFNRSRKSFNSSKRHPYTDQRAKESLYFSDTYSSSYSSSSSSGTIWGMDHEEWDKLNDDLDAVQSAMEQEYGPDWGKDI